MASKYDEAGAAADQILTKYDLCDQCLGRFFSRQLHLSSNRLLGERLCKKRSGRCHICKNLFDGMGGLLKLMADSSRGISFATFRVGVILQPSIIDRDDQIRSKFKLKGAGNIKADVAKELAKSFAKKTKKQPALNPDAVFTVNIKEHLCDVHSRHLVFSGRYLKKDHILQKQGCCTNCLGKGCMTCDLHGLSGYDSVQGFVSKLLFDAVGGTVARFTWVGGEDKSSLVLGSGRPFFVKLYNPCLRSIKFRSARNDTVLVRGLKIIQRLPQQPMQFTSKLCIIVRTGSRLTGPVLRRLGALEGPITIHEKSGRYYTRHIYFVDAAKLSDHEFRLVIDAQGGLPVKRLVTGDGVSASVSEILGSDCSAVRFDVLDVKITP